MLRQVQVSVLRTHGAATQMQTKSTYCKIHCKITDGRLTRRDWESVGHRFWKYENTTITFYPVDQLEPRLGGKVKASVVGLDVRTFTPYSKTYHGVYGEDFVSFGSFKSSANPIDSDSTLLQLFEAEHADVIDKHTFKFNNN